MAENNAQDDGFKVFVGNLPFSTTSEDLKTFFDAYNVGTAQVILRGTRSLGYGFVTFSNQADAERAVKDMDKKDLGGREINVELTKPRDENAERPSRGRGRGGFRGGRGGFRPVNGTGEDTAQVGAYRGRGGFRGRGRGRGGYNGGAGDEVAAPAEGEGAPFRGRGRGRGGFRGGRGAARGTGRPMGDVDDNAELSKTMLFVANVPFRFQDEDLKEVFKGYNVASAHVVRMKNGRSKGFGFVEVANEAEHKKVLAEATSLQADGRDLVVRAARANQTPIVDGSGGDE